MGLGKQVVWSKVWVSGMEVFGVYFDWQHRLIDQAQVGQWSCVKAWRKPVYFILPDSTKYFLNI